MTVQRHKLADIAEALKSGGILTEDDRATLSEAFDRIMGGENAAVALGVAVGPGQRSFQYAERHRRRDKLLRATAERFWPGKRQAEQARQLHFGISRYRNTPWINDRVLEECPARLVGTEQEMFWKILKEVDAVLAITTISEILRGS
jgi:hypothetical protein